MNTLYVNETDKNVEISFDGVEYHVIVPHSGYFEIPDNLQPKIHFRFENDQQKTK